MQVLYDEINQATLESFRGVRPEFLHVPEVTKRWFEIAEAKRQELLSEGLVESVKELDEMVRVQKLFS